jgi:hypothetical protein
LKAAGRLDLLVSDTMERGVEKGYVCAMTAIRTAVTLVSAMALWQGPTLAQGRPPRSITGTWRAQTPEGPREVVVRPDSSASYGDETVRWRLVGDSLYLAFGDEWVGYVISARGSQLTVSGGDLEEPMKLRRVGPPTTRPDSVPVPAAPPTIRKPEAVPGRVDR